MIKRRVVSILVLPLLFGCATTQITPIRRGEPVAIVVARSPQADGVIAIDNKDLGSSTAKGAGTGAGAGAVYGGLAGLACGPFAPMCVPIGVVVGAITGTVAGAGVGAGVAVMGSIPDEKAAQLRDRLQRVQQSHPLLVELQKNVTDRAQKYWKLGADQPAALVTVELHDLLLQSTSSEQLSCVVRAQVSVQQRGVRQAEPPEQKMYEYVSPFSSLSLWLDESSDFVDTLLTSASQQIAAHIVSDLARN